MAETTTPPEPSTSPDLEYRLTEADVRRYCIFGRPGKCWRACRQRKAALAILAILGVFLVGMCYHERGAWSGTLALGATLAVLIALAWSRQAWADRRVCRVARQVGLPSDLRVTVSPEGITKAPGPDPSDPGRTFAWSEVVEVDRIDGLTVIRLRPAGGVLIVPDRAFPTVEARDGFGRSVRAWREAAHS
jgi:hypothetical protein